MHISFYDQSISRHSLVDRLWHMQEKEDGMYPLYATVQWGIVFSRIDAKNKVTLIGPRLKPEQIRYTTGEYFIGIVFHGDTELRGIDKIEMLNKVEPLQVVDQNTFIIANEAFSIPTYETLDKLAHDLVERNIISAAPIAASSYRDTQRKFKKHIGLSPKQIKQASRVEQAIDLLSKQQAISAVALQTGFADQAHMTRDFKKFVGLTPSETSKFFKDGAK